jgi:hypothetical protein
MATVLTDIVFPSIYAVGGSLVSLPKRMSRCTPDTKAALMALAADLTVKGGELRLSDLFRSYDMQLQAHLDHVSGKKKAFSPAPGGSMHEAGRAFDVDLGALRVSLAEFWAMAKLRGVVPIIDQPKASISEAWHFECRGSHQLVFDDYASRSNRNFKPARAMAVSAILAIGQTVNDLRGKDEAARIQSALIRLGKPVGNIDGDLGPKSRAALKALGLEDIDPSAALQALTERLEKKYPDEFFERSEMSEQPW